MRKPSALCTLEQLTDGTYSLDQLADFHEAMDEQEEYEARWGDWADEQRDADRKEA